MANNSNAITNNSNTQIKKFISTSYDYFLRPSEKVLTQLQRQLQLLSIVDDLSIFEPSSLATVEFYTCLDQLLSKDDTKNQISWKAVILVSHIVKSRPALLALRDEIQILPVLSEFLQIENLSKDKYCKTLLLLQKISHNIKIYHSEGWLLRLLPHLVLTIVGGMTGAGGGMPSSVGSSTQVADESLVQPALATLTNLCRENPPVLHCLRSWTNTTRLVNSLLTQQSSSQQQQLLCLELYLLIHSADPSTAAAAARLQGSHLMALLLSVCRDGLSHCDPEAVTLATDALRSIAGMPHLHHALREYKHHHKEVRAMLSLLSECGGPGSAVTEAAAAFLATLLRLRLPRMEEFYPDVIERVVSWVSGDGPNCSSYLQLLHALLHTAGDAQLDQHLPHFGEAALLLLRVSNVPFNLHSLSLLVDALQLLQALTSRTSTSVSNSSLPLNKRLCLSPDHLADLLPVLSDYGGHLEMLRQRGGCRVATRRQHDVTSGCQLDATLANTLLSPADTMNATAVANCSDRSVSSNGTGMNNSGSLLCSEAIVRVLAIMKILGKQDGQFMLHYTKLQEGGSLMSHVVLCQRSRRRSLVKLATELLYDTSLSQDCLEALISSTFEANERSSHDISQPLATSSVPAPLEAMETTVSSDWGGSGVSCLSLCNHADMVERVEEIMSRLKAIADNNDMRGQPLSDLVDLYEFTLAGMAHSEQALQGLLGVADAKSRQLHRSLMQAQAENTRVRQLLLVWEQRVADVQRERQAALENIRTVQEQSNTFREMLLKDKTAIERENSRLRGTINTLHGDLRARDEQLTKLSAQLKERGADLKTAQRCLEQERQARDGVQQQLTALQASHSDGRKEFEALQKTMTNLEVAHAKQKQENVDLEKVIRELEHTISEKDHQIDELTKTNDSLQRIRDMIHNISSGKQPH